MDGFRRKTEGLCHISQLRQERVKAVADVVNRGDSVKVKVLKIDNNRISLSMKEVDQRTGGDLNPQEAPLKDDAIMGLDDRALWMNPDRDAMNKRNAATAQATTGKGMLFEQLKHGN